jgi:hypothetical protein
LLCCSEEPPRSLFGILTLLQVGIGIDSNAPLPQVSKPL